jgi:hypothetical protein
MIWCAIVLVIALLTGRPVVIPVCEVPSEPTATVEVGARPSPARRPASRPGARIMGRASWYDWRTGEAAAGPALRRSLGPSWRGQTVVVCRTLETFAACAKVKLTDWCQCYEGTPRERIIDLDRATFALFAQPSRGIVNVEVRQP